MQLLINLLTLLFISSCTTIEVTKEVVKVGNVVKEKVEEMEDKVQELAEDYYREGFPHPDEIEVRYLGHEDDPQ